MEISSCSAVLDTDFILHVAETEWSKEKMTEILVEVLNGVGVIATVHPLVFENEFLINGQFSNDKVRWLFDSNTIGKASFEDIFQGSEDRKAYYCFLVPELYKRLKGDTYPVSGDDILSFWRKKVALEKSTLYPCVSYANAGCFSQMMKIRKHLRKSLNELP